MCVGVGVLLVYTFDLRYPDGMKIEYSVNPRNIVCYS